MRRLAVVGSSAPPAGEADGLDEALAWLGTLPSGGAAVFDRLADVPLDRVDLVWVRGAVAFDTRVPAWLEGGGRLLATGEGVLLAAQLGLERAPPVAGRLPDPASAGFGLAGFGAHPLFTGLIDGALLGPSAPLHGIALWCYDRVWPERATVVAVERDGLAILAGRILAWEYRVGAGGMLCLGLEPALGGRSTDATGSDAEIVVTNALLGDAIPHRERPAPAACWPRPGMRATRGAAGPTAPMLSTPSDPWPPSSMPALERTPAASWTHAGRRVLVTAEPTSGHRDVWAPPFRVMHAVAVRDAIACAPGHVAADEVAGGLALGGRRLLERWVAAADVPAVAWEIAGPEAVKVVAEWWVDLRRAWPYPDGAYGDLTFDVAPDRRSLRVEAAGGPGVVFAVAGGALSAEGSVERPVVRITCAGTTPLRILGAAGANAGELRDSIRVAERGVREMAAARARRAAQLDRFGTTFQAPDPRLTQGFAWARQRGDEALVAVPGGGRASLSTCPRDGSDALWCFGAEACAAAAAQLIGGNRDPGRELLKYLARTQQPDGGIASHHPMGGLRPVADAASTIAFLQLAERLLAWTGDRTAILRERGSLAAALEYLARRTEPDVVPNARVLDALEPLAAGAGVAEAIAMLRRRGASAPPAPTVAAHAVIEAAAAALRRAPGARPGTEAGTALLEAVASLWELEPDGPGGALALAPSLPAGWNGFFLRGLRVGASSLDLEVRRRPEAVVIRAARRSGPRVLLSVAVRGVDVVGMEVDDVALQGSRARFEAHDRHEIRFHLR
ncbi:MAG: hypothetical protein ABIQ49_07760 [Gemmatimonadales bacterium]